MTSLLPPKGTSTINPKSQLPANAEGGTDPGLIPGQEDPLEKEMAAHPSILVRRIPWTEEPGGLQFRGSQELDTTERLSIAQHSMGAGPLSFTITRSRSDSCASSW